MDVNRALRFVDVCARDDGDPLQTDTDRCLLSLAAEVRANVMCWMPIATAPKDSTPIDIWRPGFGNDGGERCTNMRRVDLGRGNTYYEPVESGPTCVRNATHWMPIPEAPG